MAVKNVLDHYLKHYAAAESRLLTDFPDSFDRALCVPVYREAIAVRERFLAWIIARGNCLLVIVLNSPPADADEDWDWARPWLANPEAPVWQNKQLCYSRLANGCGLLLVNRLQTAPAGVGAARKTGNDLLCALYAQRQLHQPWLANTDADALLPEDYFSQLPHPSDGVSAVLFPFRHIAATDTALTSATQLYEFTLHYYVCGLAYANSPYAYHSLGSTMVVAVNHYAAVRGFPQRQAGEDFYLLNKLAKTGRIVSLPQPVVHLQCRHSSRAPFGTGPMVRRILAHHGALADWPCYHPAGFQYLRAFLRALASELTDQCRDQPDLPAVSAVAPLDEDILDNLYAHSGAAEIIQHCRRQGKTAAQRLRQLHTRFDAFHSLKCIHWLRDRHLGSLPLRALADHPDYQCLLTPTLMTQYAELMAQLSSPAS